MKKIHIYIVLLLGVFLMPSTAMACGNSNSSKESCAMEMTSKTKKSCCGTKSCSKNEKQKSCSGKCGHAACTTSSVSMSFLLNATFETPNNVFDFSTERQKFYSTDAILSDGYSSIWLIPKIG